MKKLIVTSIGKAVRTATKLRGGGGSALPGLVIEKIDSTYVASMLRQLPLGVVVVSGTNGKTTTTKMVVELLESQGLTVFTNKTGSNFVRGVAAALANDATLGGKIRADIAVLELDEAHAVHFVKTVAPNYSLLLNVMRDQLDRFGEIDTTAKMLQTIAEVTNKSVVINREDPRLLTIGTALPAQKPVYYGLSEPLRKTFVSDDDMRSGTSEANKNLPDASGTLLSLNGKKVRFELGGREHVAALQLEGIYNTYNAVAALTLVATICGENTSYTKLIERLATITPAFGRGETIMVQGQPLELVLVKNPSGFRLGLQSFDPNGYATMIAINDNYADGRDMSWLWDVDFHSLTSAGVQAVTGIRAYDMALRLQYDDVPVEKDAVLVDTHESLERFIRLHAHQPKRIYCTYTAMLALRKQLEKHAAVEKVL